MIVTILLLLAGAVLTVHFVGLRAYGRDAWAPIAVLTGIVIVGLGTTSAAWLTARGFTQVARNPGQGSFAAVHAITGFLTLAQETGLILIATAAAMAMSTLVARRPAGSDTTASVGGVWRQVVLSISAVALVGAVLMVVLDAVQARHVIAAMGSRFRGDAWAASMTTVRMLVAMLLCGLVLTAGSGVVAIVGVFVLGRDRPSPFQATFVNVLLAILAVVLLAASVDHVLTIRDLRRIPASRLGS